MRKHATAVYLGLLAASLFLLLQHGAVTNSDGASVYAVTRSIVEDGDLSVEPEFGIAGRNGDYFSKYGIGLSLLGVVPYALVRPLAGFYDRPDALEQAAVASLLPLASALLVVALFALCRRLGAGVRSSILVALGAVAGTFLLVYTNEFFGEPVVALFLVIALERALAGRRGNRGPRWPPARSCGPRRFCLPSCSFRFSGSHEASRRSSDPAFRYLASWSSRSRTTTSDSAPRSKPATATAKPRPFAPRGAAELLFYPEKGLFLFAPVVVLAPIAFIRLWQTSRAAATLLGGTVLVGFLAMATARGADSWSWGPRHLIAIVPVLLAPCALWLDSSARRAHAFLALCALGFAISASAALVPTQAQQLDARPPSSPTIWRQYELVPPTVRYSLSHTGDRSEDDHRHFLDLWQVGAARELGRPGVVAAVPITAVLVVLAVWSALALRRSLPAPEPTPRRSAR